MIHGGVSQLDVVGGPVEQVPVVVIHDEVVEHLIVLVV